MRIYFSVRMAGRVAPSVPSEAATCASVGRRLRGLTAQARYRCLMRSAVPCPQCLRVDGILIPVLIQRLNLTFLLVCASGVRDLGLRRLTQHYLSVRTEFYKNLFLVPI